MDILPEGLPLGGYQYHFATEAYTSQIQLFMLGHERHTGDRYRLNGLERPEKNHFLLQYTLSGCGQVRLGRSTHAVPPGTAILLHFPDDNEYYVDPNAGEWEFVYMMVRGHGLEPIWMNAIRTLGALPYLNPNAPLLRLLYTQIAQAAAGNITDAFEASRVAYDFSMELSRTAARMNSEAYPPLVEQALKRLQCDYATVQGVEQLAASLSVSKSHLIRTFSHATGISPGRYLRYVRMRQAVVLLQNSDLTLDNVAVQVGYDNGNYFSKVFTAYFGQSPSEYRCNPMNRNAKVIL